jgi:hypothetical protein
MITILSNRSKEDLAPKLTGIKDRDEGRLVELLDAAVPVARDVLKPSGAMVAKVFMGGRLRNGTSVVRAGFRPMRGRAHAREPPGLLGAVTNRARLPGLAIRLTKYRRPLFSYKDYECVRNIL